MDEKLSDLNEKVLSEANLLDYKMERELKASIEKSQQRAHQYLSDITKARLEHKIRKKIEEVVEASMTRKVDEALAQFESSINKGFYQ